MNTPVLEHTTTCVESKRKRKRDNIESVNDISQLKKSQENLTKLVEEMNQSRIQSEKEFQSLKQKFMAVTRVVLANQEIIVKLSSVYSVPLKSITQQSIDSTVNEQTNTSSHRLTTNISSSENSKASDEDQKLINFIRITLKERVNFNPTPENLLRDRLILNIFRDILKEAREAPRRSNASLLSIQRILNRESVPIIVPYTSQSVENSSVPMNQSYNTTD